MESKVLVNDLSSQRDTSIWIGMVLVLATMYVAFEWTDREVKVQEVIEDLPTIILEDEMIPITQQPEQQPAAPVIVNPEVPEILNIVPDDTEIPEKEIVTSEEVNQAIVAVAGTGTPTSAAVQTVAVGEGVAVAPPPPPVVEAPPPAPEPEPVHEEVEDNTIYDAPQVMASYPGGENALYAWLGKNIKYPPRCQDQSVQGRVMLKFVVEKDGSIGAVQVLRSPDDDLSKEAVRVTKAMPKWNPAKQGGKPVRAYFTLPVMFRIQ